jgi:hypothetical protein
MSAVVAAPDRTLAQRLDALKGANVIRCTRAQMKKDIEAGRVSAADVLREVPSHAESMKVFDLLLVVPKVGRVKANKILRAHVISPSKTVAGLSERQREMLLAVAADGWRL